MATGVASWSQTAASNNVSDSNVNWQEGQAPSTVNDSARAMMASVAKYRDDAAGSITTSGTSTAYTITSNQGFASLAALGGRIIAFAPHVTNLSGGTTLNVDSTGAKPLRTAPGCELATGTLIAGTPYIAMYNSSDQAFYLHAAGGVPGVPIGVVLPYTANVTPSSHFIFPAGQAISRTTYASYFNLVTSTFGSGDGSTTFNVPDMRGRILAGLDNLGGTNANRIGSGQSGYGSLNGAVFGSAGGEAVHALTALEAAALAYTSTVTDPGHFHSSTLKLNSLPLAGAGTNRPYVLDTSSPDGAIYNPATDLKTTGITVATSSNAGGGGHNNMPPTIVLSYILRVL